jgi:hypothetical protein
MSDIKHDLTELLEKRQSLLDSIDLIASNAFYSVGKKSGAEAKRKIVGATNTLIGRNPGGFLPDYEIARMVEVVKDIPIRGRKMVLFMETEDGLGIVEVLTGKVFNYK